MGAFLDGGEGYAERAGLLPQAPGDVRLANLDAAVSTHGVTMLARQQPSAEVRQVERMITLATGGTIQVRSADDPQSLRGDGLDLAVLDECAYMKAEAWEEALRPALWRKVVPPGAEWQPYVAYAVGAEVTYAGARYRCRQAHTSLPGWEPPKVLALWLPIVE